MSTVTATVPDHGQTDATWLRLVQVCTAVAVVPLAVFAVVGTFFTTISGGGDFKYTADYWYTAVGLPITLIGIGITLGMHKLQHGSDGRLGTIGVWVNTVALVELFVQLGASVIEGTEVRWGPSYPVCALLSFVGVALLAAGSWRSAVLPRWMLGAWPLVWILGSLAAMGPTPLVLAAFFILLGIALTRRVRSKAV
jgi:hypothetical protein